MIIISPFSHDNPRLRVLGLLVGAGLLLLLVSLGRVQILRADRYGDREQAQSLRRIRIPSARGEIVDRNGVILANNRPSYDVVIYLDQMKRRSKRQDIVEVAAVTLRALSQSMNQPVALTVQEVRDHFARRRPLPLTVWRDLSPEQVASFVERGSGAETNGVDLIATPARQYPNGPLAAHAIGYVARREQNRDDPEEDLEHFYYYQPDSIGQQGVERACDEWLRGESGGRTIRVSPAGMTVGDIGYRGAERGDRVVLTLDARLQRIVEDALVRAPQLPAGKELRGAAVLLDVRTGSVLAMASVPTFDPNLFNPGVPSQSVNNLLTNPASPMLNRAIGASYAPGSTFKPVTLLAGLQSGTVTVNDTVICRGSLQIGSWPRPFNCWNTHGHGPLAAIEAVTRSCDIWFYDRGMAAGVDAIAKMATDLGLGQPTGFDVGHEQTGLVPTPAWKWLRKHDRWREGDTAQLAIGQSFLLATPLQMANLAATLANGGTSWRPFLIQRVESISGETIEQTAPEVRARLTFSPSNLDTVRRAMLSAVESADGTGHLAALKGVPVAGKTGTAEVETPHGRIKRAWFIGFAPYDQPQFALSVVLEDAVSGGHNAAPVAGSVFAGIFGKNVAAVTGGGGD